MCIRDRDGPGGGGMPARHPARAGQLQECPEVRHPRARRGLGRLGLEERHAVRDLARHAQCEFEAC
eukprot:3309659-Alexandrium_andersonii.AAC.1